MQEKNLTSILKNFDTYKKLDSAEKCISAFESLLVTHQVDFKKLLELDANRVIRWGLPLTFIDKSCLAESFLEKIVKSVLKNGSPAADAFAELQAISLLLAMGATSGNKIPVYNDKVYDFDLRWSDKTIEIEVTKASIKETHIARTDQANKICEDIFAQKKPFDIHLFLADLLSGSSRRYLLKAALSVECGQIISKKNIWQLQGVPIERDVYELYSVGKSENKPSWWPKEVANLFTIKQMGAGPERKIAPPQVKVNYVVPLTGYINPAKKKARNFQGSRKKPFLIIIEVNNLPNAISAFNTGINDLFNNWPHISGIILFFDYLSFKDKEIGWELKLFVNQNANRPLPNGIINKLGKQNRNMRLVTRNS